MMGAGEGKNTCRPPLVAPMVVVVVKHGPGGWTRSHQIVEAGLQGPWTETAPGACQTFAQRSPIAAAALSSAAISTLYR